MVDPPGKAQRGAVTFPLLEVGNTQTSKAAMDSITRLCLDGLCPGVERFSFALAPNELLQNGCL